MSLRYKVRNLVGNVVLNHPVNKVLLDRIKLMDTNPMSEKAQLLQKKQLSDIIHFHSQNYDDYKGAGVGNFHELPVISKRKLKNTLSPVKNENFKEISTSGSTGVPFHTYWSKNKDRINKLEVLYFNKKLGVELGHKMYFLRVWNEINRPSYISKKLRNYIPIDVSHLSFEETEKMIERLEADHSPKFLLGYGSALENVYFLRKKLIGLLKEILQPLLPWQNRFRRDAKRLI